MTEAEDLATLLHQKLCRSEHTEACGWYYEEMKSYPTPMWEAWTHKRYLKKADKVLKKFEGKLDLKTVGKLLDLVEE